MAEKDKFELAHEKAVNTIQNKIGWLFEIFAKEVASAASLTIKSVDPLEPFSLDSFPLTKKRIEKLIKELSSGITTTVIDGVKSQWTLANEKNNELCNKIFGELVGKLTKEQKRLYYTSNSKALTAFLQRKHGQNGLSLSQQVWHYVGQSRNDIERTLELGLKTGESAAKMASNLKMYLREPDRLYRRVRGADGELHLSKPAAEYHPGAGVYRSSYKNALRLAVTETNMSYQNADHLRHQQLDFIVGIQISLSNNHTLNGKPFTDICDELQGRYPKDIQFEGFHPFCRCIVTTILKTPEEVARDMDGIDRGSVNAVKDMPQNFKSWLFENRDRIQGAERRGTLPYFLDHNRWAWQEGAEKPVPYKNALAVAIERHARRTPEQAEAIRAKWHERYYTYHYAENVAKIAGSIPDILEYDELGNRQAQLLEILAKGDATYAAIRAKARHVAELLKDYINDCKYLDKPLDVFQEYGIEHAFAVNAAVENNVTQWRAVGLNHAKKKLEFEIGWVEKNKKYSTWKVAQDAYRKALDEVETDLFWEVKSSQINLNKNRAKAMNRYDLIARIDRAYRLKDIAMMDAVLSETAEEYFWWEKENYEVKQFSKSGKQIILSGLEAKTGVTYYTNIVNAIKERNKTAYNAAFKAAEDAVAEYQSVQAKSTTVITKLLKAGEIDKGREIADAIAVYDIKETKRLIAEAEEYLEIKALIEQAEEYTENGTYEGLLEKNGYNVLLSDIKAVIITKDKPLLQFLIKEASNVLKEFEDAVKALDKYITNPAFPKDLKDIYSSANLTYDIAALKALLTDAQEWEAQQQLAEDLEELKAFKTKSKPYAKELQQAEAYLRSQDWDNLKLTIEKLKTRKQQIEQGRGYSKITWGDEYFTEERKRDALWGLPEEVDNALRSVAGKSWNSLTEYEKRSLHNYTGTYHYVNEPWRGVHYYGNPDNNAIYRKKNGKTYQSALEDSEDITKAINSSYYNFDMWVQRYDDALSLMKFGLNPYDFDEYNPERGDSITEEAMLALIGKTGTDGAITSCGVSKGKGYPNGRHFLFNIFIPRKARVFYIEPISQLGNGDGISWDGVSQQSSFAREQEAVIQRGTTFRITDVKKGNGNIYWYIDMEVIAQQPLKFPYSNGYPYTSFSGPTPGKK